MVTKIIAMKKKNSTQRNREQSMQKLVDAVGKIIIRDGFKNIGINAVATEARLDKVLIYRYFGGLDGLLREFAKQRDFYIKTSELINKEVEYTGKDGLKSVIIKILTGQLRELLGSRELQELMLWEMLEKNELTGAIAREREMKGFELSMALKRKMDIRNNDSDAVIALLVSGIYYLVLRSRTVDVFNGIQLNSEEGWQKVENAIKQIVNTYFNQ